jgi:quercetin dioxygenase-like cupin family protein
MSDTEANQPTATKHRPIKPFTFRESVELFESGVMEIKDTPDAIFTAATDDSMTFGMDTHVLFADAEAGTDGMSLAHAWLAPHYDLPPHSHNGDCLYYVVEGSIQLGKRELKKGDGFFVPKDSTYRYIAGENGAEVIEFRTAVAFDFRYRDTDPERWTDRFQTAATHREEWKQARADFHKRISS